MSQVLRVACGGVGVPPVLCVWPGGIGRGTWYRCPRGGRPPLAGSSGRPGIRPPAAGRAGIAGHPRRWPWGPFRLRYFVRFCPGARAAVSVIAGHRRRISPLLTRGNARAALLGMVCSILRVWNGGCRCLFPRLTRDLRSQWPCSPSQWASLPARLTLSWLKLVRKSAGVVDGVEGLA